MAKKKTLVKTPSASTESFFEEPSADDARARRMARQKEDVETVSQKELQDGSLQSARERRLARLKEKEAQTPKEVEKTSQIKSREAKNEVSEADKGSIFYFKKNWTVELHNDKFKVYADGKNVYDIPTKPIL